MALCKEKIFEIINTPFFYSVRLCYGESGLMSVSFIEKCGSSLVKHKFSFITNQVIQYFEGKRINFTEDYLFPTLPRFTTTVLSECKKIPYGQTTTYKDLAVRCGSPKAYRAVGNALRENPLPIIIPCHRVVGSNGDLTGFMGKNGIEIKRSLLRLEGLTL